MISDMDIKNVMVNSVAGLSIEAIDSNQDFLDLGLDSLDHLTILLALEEVHGIEKIPDEDVDKCRSVSGILDYLSN